MTQMYCIQDEVVQGGVRYHIALAAGRRWVGECSSQHQHHTTPDGPLLGART